MSNQLTAEQVENALQLLIDYETVETDESRKNKVAQLRRALTELFRDGHSKQDLLNDKRISDLEEVLEEVEPDKEKEEKQKELGQNIVEELRQ